MPTSVTAGKLLDAMPALRELSALDVPVKLSFKMQRIIKRIQTEVDSVVEVRKKIVEEFTQKTDDGKVVHPTDKDGKEIEDQVKLTDPEAYKVKMKELLDEEVKFGFDKIHEAELGEKVTIKPAVLVALDWLFIE